MVCILLKKIDYFYLDIGYQRRYLSHRMILWIGDLNETYFVGNVDEASRQLVKCTYECLEKAIAIGRCC